MTRPWTAGPWRFKPWSSKEGMIVAGTGKDESFITGHALNADAHLIVEAPNLYEALDACERMERGG